MSKISRTESKNAPPDMSPFLEDIEKLRIEIFDIKSQKDQFITKDDLVNLKNDSENDDLKTDLSNLQNDLEQFRKNSTKRDEMQKTTESQIISAQNGVEILTKTVQTLSEFEKIFEKNCDERFCQISTRIVQLEEKSTDQEELESLRDLDEIRKSVTEGRVL